MEQADAIRPIWRTGLAAVLAGWMLLVVGAILGSWRLAEILPATLVPAALVGLAVSAIALLVWSLGAMLRDPITGWMGSAALLFFCGALVPAYQPLSEAGVRLNFEAHRPAYDRIVAEAKARGAIPDDRGWVEGERDGVRFRYRAARPEVIEFAWTRSDAFETGVRYNEIPCTPSPTLKCIDRGRPLAGHYFHYWFMS